MNDAEMLELAAKAAGMFVLPKPWPDVDGWFFCLHHDAPALHFRSVDRNSNHIQSWAPLTDDGDAFRLMVELRIRAQAWGDNGSAAAFADVGEVKAMEPHYGDDPGRALRIAIVRVAAEIGKDAP